MVATIRVSPYIFVQGKIERLLPDGSVAIRDGDREYVGQPLMGPTRMKPGLIEAALGH
jgi:hypothetical protein